MLNIKIPSLIFLFFALLFLGIPMYGQKINQFDSNNKRTGIWKKYYPNKRIRYEGEFKNGKEMGVFKFYDIRDSKFPIAKKTYSRRNDTVLAEFFTINGQLQSKGGFMNKKRVGKWRYFFPDGKILSEEFYLDGKLEGEIINYYPNGKVAQSSNYTNGLKEGLSKKYSSKGVLIEEINYQNGKPNGLAKYFELNGNLKETGVYKQGKRVGNWEYYLDGEISSKKELEKENKYQKKGN